MFVKPVLNATFVTIVVAVVGGMLSVSQAADSEQAKTIKGVVQQQDLRRVPQAAIEVKNQAGDLVSSGFSNDAGEFKVAVPESGTYSVSAVQETYRSEYVVLTLGEEPVNPVTLTLSKTKEVSLEVVSPLPPIQTKASSETYSLSRKEIDILPRGNNNDLHDVLLTIPGAAYGSLKQVHIRQDHANLQLRIDGVPIPDAVSSTFSDVITPRAWERADIVLGGMEANVGNKTAALIDITTKSGTKPGFGSVQMFGGSNKTINPSFEYGGTIGEKFRYYFLNSHTATNRGIEPPTLGHSIFHGQSERNQTMFRGDYQYDNNNNITLLFLNSIAKYQIPTSPGLEVNPTILGLLPGGFTPVPSEMIDENQKENNQYGHLVWRHDINTRNFFSLAGYFRHTRATFRTDPLNVLAYVPDEAEPFSAGSQDRTGYSGGVRLDYTFVHSKEHLIKAGFQVDRTQAINKTRLFTFLDDGAGNPTGGMVNAGGDNRLVGWRQEFWIQDQWTPNEHWTLNIGLRADTVQYLRDEGQISPRVGVTYRHNSANAFHAYYGRLFTPPNLERVAFASLHTEGTKAAPEDITNNQPRAERAHYFQIGSVHALTDWATLQLTGYYKLANYLSDAHQLGTTPLLNSIAFERGWTRGADAALKVWFMENLTGRANIAWGQCKGYGLQSGHNLVHVEEIADINSRSGVHCDHQQTLTASGILSYRLFERTTLTGQVLFASGLRAAEEGAKTNSSHSPTYTIYNFSISHVIPLPWHGQKFLIGFDIVNALDQKYFINQGEGSIGLGVSHAGMPRSFFFRGQWFF
ncbi:TonB-dependent receptor [Candidatus Nitrospira nitrificans]|uniref:Putative TonB-dependent receptor n=1 Tax=Candidatus Nitrospira nitrificans TaxID=1742973 RepID=A0A0S4LHH3_9BACT|nr:TonB-dependent receptor [Candidatus Nitrospira nitrificans]CUS36032.1 putative TonB-dependent receptor [Candidatus Nitrospira nitrificans]